MADLEVILRPAAIVPTAAAARIVTELERNDVGRGGVWNATSSVWQRYDRAWNGVAGSHGDAQLLGTVAVVYDQPRRHEITIFKVSITPAGAAAGCTTDSLCDDALKYAELTLATCPKSVLLLPPQMDPFHGEVEISAAEPALTEVVAEEPAEKASVAERSEKSYFEKVDVGELLRMRVQKLAEVRQLGETG